MSVIFRVRSRFSLISTLALWFVDVLCSVCCVFGFDALYSFWRASECAKVPCGLPSFVFLQWRRRLRFGTVPGYGLRVMSQIFAHIADSHGVTVRPVWLWSQNMCFQLPCQCPWSSSCYLVMGPTAASRGLCAARLMRKSKNKSISCVSGTRFACFARFWTLTTNVEGLNSQDNNDLWHVTARLWMDKLEKHSGPSLRRLLGQQLVGVVELFETWYLFAWQVIERWLIGVMRVKYSVMLNAVRFVVCHSWHGPPTVGSSRWWISELFLQL